MKSNKADLARALDNPDPKTLFYLFYGPDEAQSRAYAARLLNGLNAEKLALSAQALKSDPATLADEAAAIGLFGGKRALWVEPAGDEIAPAAETLLGSAAAENPAIAIAGALRKTSALVKLAEASPRALAHASYELGERDAERVVEEIARSEGLHLDPGLASRIAAAAGNDRGIVAQEVSKLALYVDASPESPERVGREIVDNIAAGGDGDGARLGDLALLGDVDALTNELDAIVGDAEPIAVVRALQRRLLMLIPIRVRVARGARPQDAVTSAGKSVFWKEKNLVSRLVAQWDSKALERVMERSGELERRLMQKASPPLREALEYELLAIARTARRR